MNLPPDPEEMNDARAEWAGQAINTFINATGIHEESNETALQDLLVDLRHWADRQGIEWEAAVLATDVNYAVETGNG